MSYKNILYLGEERWSSLDFIAVLTKRNITIFDQKQGMYFKVSTRLETGISTIQHS